jgi:membrane protease YdiL (CAAX protease family)
VTGNLWLPVAIHFAWNFFEGPLFGLTVSGRGSLAQSRMITLHGPEIFTGGAFGIEAGIVATLVTLAAIYSVRQIAPAAP